MVVGRIQGVTATASRAVAPAAPGPVADSAHRSTLVQIETLRTAATGNQIVRPLSWSGDALAQDNERPDSPPLAPANDSIVCHCASVEREALIDAVRAGCHTVQALSMRTRAGTVCGGCLPRLAELAVETRWQAARCIEVIDRALRIKSFRFEVPPQHQGWPIQPGQRLIVRATIGGLDVQRPYTLTSPVTQRRYYEITVQREPQGLMSNWLFDNMGPGVAIELLPPSGTCTFELRESNPLVCLVGGIGITPALGICRSVAASSGQRQVHVDYSASTREQVVCSEELTRLALQHPAITCRIRITGEEGRFRLDDIAKLSGRYSDADWLVCGSSEFRSYAERLLRERGVQSRNIHIESFQAFTNVVPAKPTTTAVLSPLQRTLVGYALLAAIGAFAVQALFGVKWAWLDQLQTKTVYSALTGTALLLLLMLQWRLAYVRLRHGVPKTARAYGFHIASGPAVLAMILMHSTNLGYGLSMAVCLGCLGSLATGAILSAHPRSPRWQTARRVVLASHIAMSCAGSGLAVAHGVNALWY